MADFHKAVETYASHFERAAVNLQKVVSPAPGTRQKHETNSYHPGIIGMSLKFCILCVLEFSRFYHLLTICKNNFFQIFYLVQQISSLFLEFGSKFFLMVLYCCWRIRLRHPVLIEYFVKTEMASKKAAQ